MEKAYTLRSSRELPITRRGAKRAKARRAGSSSPRKKPSFHGPGKSPKKKSIEEAFTLNKSTPPKIRPGSGSSRKGTASDKDDLTSTKGTPSKNWRSPVRSLTRASPDEEVITPVKKATIEEVEISDNSASSSTEKLLRKKRISATVSQPLLEDNLNLKLSEGISQDHDLERLHGVSQETSNIPLINTFNLKKKRKAAIKKKLRAECKDHQEIWVNKFSGAMDTSEDCDTESEVQSSDLPIAGRLYQVALASGDSGKSCVQTEPDNLERDLAAMFGEDAFGVDSPMKNNETISSPFQNDSPDLGFGVSSPNAGNAEITSDSQNNMTSPGWIGVASLEGSQLGSTTGTDEMTDVRDILSEKTSSVIRELGMGTSGLSKTNSTGGRSPWTESQEIVENFQIGTEAQLRKGSISKANLQVSNLNNGSCEADTSQDKGTITEVLLKSRPIIQARQQKGSSNFESRQEIASPCAEKESSEDEIPLQRRKDAESLKVPNISVSNTEKSPDKTERGRAPLTENSQCINEFPSPHASNLSQETSTPRAKRTSLDCFTSQPKRRRKQDRSASSVLSIQTPPEPQPSNDRRGTSPIPTTSKEKRSIPGRNLQDRREERGSSNETEMREGMYSTLISNTIVKRVILLDVTPKLRGLIRKDSRNLVKGFCWAGCRRLTNFNCQMWRYDSGVSEAFCKICMDAGLENMTMIDFWFTAKFKIFAEDSTIEVIFSGERGAKFLGCSRIDYISSTHTRKQVHLRLKKLITDKKVFDLSYLKVKTTEGEHFRAV